MNRSQLNAVTLALGLMAATADLQAQARGAGATGIPYASGGVGQSEQALLYDERLRYTLWLTTAARRSGAYLAGAEVRITDLDSRKVVLEHALAGPWLMAGLPAGRYALAVHYQSTPADARQTRRAVLNIGDRGLRRLVLYFDADDQVDTAREPSFESHVNAPSGKPRRSQDR